MHAGRQLLRWCTARFEQRLRWLAVLRYLWYEDLQLKPWWPRDPFFPKRGRESIREYTQHTLEQSLAGSTLNAIMIGLSFIMVYLYIHVVWTSGDNVPSAGISLATKIIGAIFTLDYMVRLYAAPLRGSYMTSLASAFDLICIIPTWVEISTTQAQLAAFAQQSPNNKQLVLFLRVLKAFRILRSYRLLRFTTSLVQRQVLATLLTAICTIVSMSGAMQIIELCPDQCVAWNCQDSLRHDGLKCANVHLCSLGLGASLGCCHCQSRPLFDWMYCIAVSMTTVGYGDIAPKTRLGRLAMGCMILFTFVVLPLQVNALVALMSERSKFTTRYSEYKRHPTAVLLSVSDGINPTMLRHFLREFFHPDSPNWNENVVILHLKPPGPEMLKIIHQYEPRVTYIIGSPLNVYDQKRAALREAVACFITTSRSGADVDQKCSLLTAVCRRIMAPTVPILTQVLSTGSVQHCIFSGATCVVSVEQIKLSLLSKSISVVGASTLLANLMTTVAPSFELPKPKTSWENAYLHGLRQEIYLMDLPPQFADLTYGELVLFLFQRLSVICIAAETDEGPHFLHMDHKLPVYEDSTCHVYVIASGGSAKDDVRKISLDDVRTFQWELHLTEPRMRTRTVVRSQHDIEVSRQRIDAKKRQMLKMPVFMKYLASSRTSQASAAVEALRRTTRSSSLTKTAPRDAKSPFELFLEKPLPENLRRHIIIIGIPYSLFDIVTAIKSLKTDPKEGPPAIIVLSQHKMTEATYKSIFWFAGSIYFFQGSALSASDLQHVSIQRARAIIVLGSVLSTRKLLDDNMVDADAITTVRYIIEACQHNKVKPNMIVELEKQSNVKFLSRLVQSTYRPPVQLRSPLSTVRRIHTVADDDDEEEVEANTTPFLDLPHIFEPPYVSGRVYVSGLLDHVMSEWYRKPYIVQILEMLLHGHTTDVSKQRQLFQAPLPFALYGKTFAEAFSRMLKADVICIGVLHGCGGANYVCTNPRPDTVLFKDDRLFLVGEPSDVVPI
ncbi:calcium-activated potassium channel subunit alpha-1 [Achlya hypogyna]|uniref:Calcium-activated potassium channel subunit alpha-1 n=1 Tax=Achlya hypogyna TaxID=1202772 RepID=A0A1V9ZKQ8_ACHHY|nr:calcium-activated potassium channel subunit alpha-1 [Achlya hypogyna]